MGFEPGMFEHPNRHGRHRAPALDAFGLDQGEHLRRIETSGVEHDPSAGERLCQLGGEGTDVKQRRADEVHRLGCVDGHQMGKLAGAGQHVVLIGHDRAE